MKSSAKRDLKLREKFKAREDRYRVLRSIYYNQYLEAPLRELARIKLEKLGGLRTKIKNRCVVTGRPRGVLRKYRVSRLVFKQLASAGHLVGVKKSSW